MNWPLIYGHGEFDELLKVIKAYGTPVQADKATYSYSYNGKLVSLTDANGNKMVIGYDGFDRRSSWMFPSPSTPGQLNGSDYKAYDYDAVDNRTSLRQRVGSVHDL